MVSEKTFKFTIGLLYPAVLGALIYEIFSGLPHTSFKAIGDDWTKYPLVLGIIIVFAFDYLYTNTEDIRSTYSVRQGLCDFLIVSVLFISMKTALGNPMFEFFRGYLALLLAVAKFLAFLWEVLDRDKHRFAILCFGAFSVIYFLIWLLAADIPWILITALGFDALLFFLWPRIERRFPWANQ